MAQEPRIVGARVMVEECLFLNATEFPQEGQSSGGGLSQNS